MHQHIQSQLFLFAHSQGNFIAHALQVVEGTEFTTAECRTGLTDGRRLGKEPIVVVGSSGGCRASFWMRARWA